MKKHDLTSKTKTELETELQELRAKLAQYRFDLADKKLKRTSDIKQAKLQVARILTVLPNAK